MSTPVPPLVTSSVWADPIPDVLPLYGISLLAGAPGTGKTALLATLLKAFRDQQPIFGHQPNPVAAIGLIAVDRSWSTNRLWFDRAGYPDIPQYSLADDQSYSKTRLRRRFERTQVFVDCLNKLALPFGSLVVCDPISLFLGGNLLDYDTCMVACLEIRDILHQRGYTLIGTAHTSKLRADKKERYLRLQDHILGSTALFGFTDTQMYLAAPVELNRPSYTFLWAPHMAPSETFDLGRDKQGLFVPYTGRDSATDALLDLIPTDASISLSDLVEAAQVIPLSKSTVVRRLHEFLDTGLVRQHQNKAWSRIRPA